MSDSGRLTRHDVSDPLQGPVRGIAPRLQKTRDLDPDRLQYLHELDRCTFHHAGSLLGFPAGQGRSARRSDTRRPSTVYSHGE